MNRNEMKVLSHYEVVIPYEVYAVASFKDRFDAAAFVRNNGGIIRAITKTIARPIDWWARA